MTSTRTTSCRRCGAVGFRADGCGKTHNVPARAPDTGDFSAALRGPLPLLPSVADRPVSVPLDPTDQREVCREHGWVGRQVFQRDRHDLCAEPLAPRLPCTRCSGSGLVGNGRFCKRCDGDTYEPIEEPEEHEEPATAPPVILNGPGRTQRRRNPAVAAAKVTNVQRLSDQREDVEILAWMASKEYTALVATRPKTRGDCKDGPRPCAWVGCRMHMALDINPQNGSVRVTFPGLEPWELAETCALDLAERGGATLEEIGIWSNVTRERTRQLEARGLRVLRAAGLSLRGLQGDE